MKVGKEIKVEKLNNFKVVFGTINNKDSKAVYLNVSSWLEPLKKDDINYNRVIKLMNKNIKQNIYDLISKNNNLLFMKDRTIVDLDIRESGIKYGKRSFMNCEVTFFLKTETPLNSDIVTEELNMITDQILKNGFMKNNYFNFHKRKK